MSTVKDKVRVGTKAELTEKGHIVVSGADRPIVVFYNDGDICAVDNRCPHMGFPLHKGGCSNGLIVCPWHHARFEAHSGCTFDLFAGDVEPFDVSTEDDTVFVAAMPRARNGYESGRRRLREGMETNNALVSAKAILALLGCGVSAAEVVKEAALFGAGHRDDWASGLTSLAALANLLPYLDESTAYLALYQGVRRVSADCAGQASRRQRYPLETDQVGSAKLAEWYGSWIKVRHRDAAERTLLTVLEISLSEAEVGTLMVGGALERIYADTGHRLDFLNKGFELLEFVGAEHSAAILPAHVASTASARGAEEQNNWRQPIDLVSPIQRLCDELPALFASGAGKVWNGEAELAEKLLGEDPIAILSEFRGAICAGATAVQLARATTFSAALRIARFGAANEMGDWITALHTFSYCHAMHRILKRNAEARLVAGVVHGAMSVYQDRFLNVPPQRMPLPDPTLPEGAEALRQAFLDSLDRLGQADEPARIVARYLELGHPVEALIDTMTNAVVREDADFHNIQMLEAAAGEYFEWPEGAQRRTLMVAVARYIAAFSPTQRAQLQTARIAWRLHRGEKLYEEEEAGNGADV